MARRTRVPIALPDRTTDRVAIVDRLLEEFQAMAASIPAKGDSASMRQMVSFALKGAGYGVVDVADGLHDPVERR